MNNSGFWVISRFFNLNLEAGHQVHHGALEEQSDVLYPDFAILLALESCKDHILDSRKLAATLGVAIIRAGLYAMELYNGSVNRSQNERFVAAAVRSPFNWQSGRTESDIQKTGSRTSWETAIRK